MRLYLYRRIKLEKRDNINIQNLGHAIMTNGKNGLEGAVYDGKSGSIAAKLNAQ